MPFDGSGTFNRLMNWVNDAAAGIKIKSDRHDAEDDNFAAGLSNTLTKDGQSQPTADIPMNGKKLVNVGAPTAGTDAATKSYVDTAGGNYAPKASPIFTGKVTLPQATAALASVSLPGTGTPPAAPVDGDLWATAGIGLQQRLSGVTYSYGRLEAAQTWTGAQTMTALLTMSGNGPMIKFNDTDAGAFDFWVHANSNQFYVLLDRNNDGAFEGPHPLQLDGDGSVAYAFGSKIWTAGNDGAGSGLDADLLDGLNAYAAAGAANTIAARDAAGDISIRLLRQEYPAGGDTLAVLLGQKATGTTAGGADNYARPVLIGSVANQIAGLIAPSGALGGGGTPNTWLLNATGKAILFKFQGGSGTWSMLWSPDAGTTNFAAASGLSANGGIFWVPPGWYYRLSTTATGYSIYTFQ